MVTKFSRAHCVWKHNMMSTDANCKKSQHTHTTVLVNGKIKNILKIIRRLPTIIPLDFRLMFLIFNNIMWSVILQCCRQSRKLRYQTIERTIYLYFHCFRFYKPAICCSTFVQQFYSLFEFCLFLLNFKQLTVIYSIKINIIILQVLLYLHCIIYYRN